MLMAENQMNVARIKINLAYQNNDQKEMLEARAIFERLLSIENDRWLTNYFIAYCDYRLYNLELNNDNKKAAKFYIKDGMEKLTECLDEMPDFGEAHALMSSYYGGKISLLPISGMWNGVKSQEYMGNAIKYSSDSPRVFLLDGIGKIFTPEKYGGGFVKAELSLNKAIELFESEAGKNVIPSWGHAEVYIWLGIIESKKGDKMKAKEYYQKSLEIEPENGWVKHVLLPELHK